MARKNELVFFSIIVILGALEGLDATSYTVGDSTGWTNNLPNTTFYTNWASKYTFAVGDTLVFNFATGSHDVAVVTSSSYTSCSTSNPTTTYTAGPATVVLNTTGTQYFLCQFQGHCGLGQKLSISVGGNSSSSPSPTGSPSPGSSPPPPPPRSGSSASMVSVTLVSMFMSFTMGFLCYF